MAAARRVGSIFGGLQSLLYLAGFVAAYALAAQLALLVPLADNITAPYYPAAGIALWALLAYGPRGLVVALGGELAIQLIHGTPLWLAVEIPAGEALGALAAWQLVTGWQRQQFTLGRSRDLALLLGAALLYGVLAASAGLPGLVFSGQTPPALAPTSWWVWALGDALGVITIVPLLLAWRAPLRTTYTGQRLAEALFCGAMTVGAALLTFLRGGEFLALRQPLAFPTFALQVWAALRFGLRGATAATLAVATIAIIGTHLGLGPFADLQSSDRALLLQGYVLLHCLIGLMLVVLLYERERAEGELLRQREYLRQIVDISPSLIFVRDRFHRFVFANRALAELYGVTAEEMIGKTDWDFNRNPEHSEFYASIDREVLATGEERVVPEEQIVDRAGRTRWLEVVKRPLHDEFGIPRQVVGVATDITARRDYERLLSAQRSYLRQIVDINPSLIFSKDREGRFVLVNQAIADVYGARPQDLIGKTDNDFNSNADEVAFFREMDLRVMDSGVEAFIPEERITDAQGRVRWLQTIKRPVFDENGQAVQVLGVATDITARKQAEEEKLELESRMQQAQRIESMGILAGGVAHDFNNLLVAILGNADLALLDLEQDSAAAANVRRIRTASLRATELANQMLAYSGKGRFVVVRADLNSLAEEMLRLMETALHPHAQLQHEFDPQLPAVDGDPAQLRRLVMNLVTNASDALPEAGGTILIRTSAVPSAEGRSQVMLEVKDDGIGMDNEIQQRMFEPFFTTKFTGRGLGMAAVLGIVRGHEGTIEVDSAPGQGTLIRVRLPAVQGEPPRALPDLAAVEPGLPLRTAAKQAQPGATVCTATVLVVDDDPAVCSVARRALSRHGFNIIEAHDGVQAVALFTARRLEIDVVLLDLTMPEMSGEEVLEAVRLIDPAARVVVSSGYSEADVALQLGAQTITDFLQKPYEIQELVATIQRVTGQLPEA